MQDSRKIKVFIVDDSALVRSSLSLILNRAPDIEIIGAAANPNLAMSKMKREWPDVIISDLEMPEMNGIDFLKFLNIHHPTPFIVCSSHTGVGARYSIEALSLGAVEIISKPSIGVEAYLEEITGAILDAVRAAARIGLPQPSSHPAQNSAQVSEQEEHHRPDARLHARNAFAAIAIGSSTGGTTVIEHLLKKMPVQCPPLLIVQHMPMHFTNAFARRLNELCAIQVKEAENGEMVKAGVAYIAPGGQQMELVKKHMGLSIQIHDGLPVNRHKPSVDVLFDSVAEKVGSLALGIILTGMGRDGSKGLLNMKQKGAFTLAQNEASCAVYGMPRAALEIGATEIGLSISELGAYMGGLSILK